MATQDQIDFYNENGYVVIPDFVSAAELESLRTTVVEKVASKVEEQVADAVSRSYGARMADTAKLFTLVFKDGAIEDGKLNRDPKEAIEIGFSLHLEDGVKEHLQLDKNLDISKSLGFKAPLVMFTSMYRANGNFPDRYFQLDNWILMEPAGACIDLILHGVESNAANGCFKVMKGSHKNNTNHRKNKVNPEATNFQDAILIDGVAPYTDGSQDDQFTPLEVPAGALLVLHGLTVVKLESGDSDTPASFIEAIVIETDGAKSLAEYGQ